MQKVGFLAYFHQIQHLVNLFRPFSNYGRAGDSKKLRFISVDNDSGMQEGEGGIFRKLQ